MGLSLKLVILDKLSRKPYSFCILISHWSLLGIIYSLSSLYSTSFLLYCLFVLLLFLLFFIHILSFETKYSVIIKFFWTYEYQHQVVLEWISFPILHLFFFIQQQKCNHIHPIWPLCITPSESYSLHYLSDKSLHCAILKGALERS